jgi:Dolichyl-phosphate-mannose-protein mannosyltransferase
VRTPFILYVLALVARLMVMAGFMDPAYPDSSYYVNVARQLAAGHGFSTDVVWIFAEVGGKIPANPVLPIASNAHWMPLASLVQVPFIWVLGPTALASALPFAILGALSAPLAWLIARDAGSRTFVAVGAGLLMVVPALSFAFMVQPDNFSLYQPLVAGALLLGARGMRGSPRSFALAGLLGGLATLSRNDGVLVLAVLGAAFLWDRWRTRRGFGAEPPRPARIPFLAAMGAVALFAVAVLPWYARQLATFGSLSPSTASGKVLFIRDIGEWNSIDTPATLQHLLGMGIGSLLATRVGGLVAAITIFAVIAGAIVLVPPMVIGAWRRRRDAAFGPYLGYGVLLFAFSAIVSAVHVPGGTFIHSAVALIPHAYVLALEGVVAAVAWVAGRRRTWDAERAGRVFAGAAVAFGVLAGIAYSGTVHAAWAEERDRTLAAGAALDAVGAPRDDRVMSIDASGTRYWTGHPGVVLVNDPLDTVKAVADAYGIRWLILERDDSVPAATAILIGGQRPAWVGPPILLRPDIGVYPVCIIAGDPRCSNIALVGAGAARGTGAPGR